MDSDDYLPRVLDEPFQPVPPSHTDPSKWDAVHDALENSSLHHQDSSRTTRSTGSLFTIAWVLGIALGLIWVLRNGRSVFDQWQQNVHRRANRRRHGIPDDDDRPFNVAYAAAALARRQREKEQARADNTRRERLQPESDWQPQDERLRQRGSHAQDPSTSIQRPQAIFPQPTNIAAHSTHERTDTSEAAYRSRSRSQPASNLTSSEPRLISDPYNPNRGHDQGRRDAQSDVQATATNRRLSRNIDYTPSERRKHRYVDDADDEDRTSKRTRVAGEELIDGDNDAAWIPGGSRRGSVQLSKRGSKRHANPEGDDIWEMSQDKRARMGHLPSHDVDSVVEEFSDVEMVRESSDVEPGVTRGTKREREDFAADGPTNDTEELPVRPSRKRRSEKGGSADMPSSRGLKRDRSPQRSSASDEGDERGAQMGRQKRGRRHEEPEQDSDIVSANASLSDELPEIAEDPACGGRRIGEIWEVNGQAFKVGLDGRRLRHALVRLQRSKFAMPKDSTHNDAKTSVDVVVEKWLNDDEYKMAKENFELAWQDPSPSSTPVKGEASKQENSPASGGKRLLWAGPPPSPVKGRASMSSVQNPFELAPHNTGRRIASAHLFMNQPAESPKLRSSKSFSKWEKQDLEASSLKKMRARIEKEKEQQKEQQEKEKAKAKTAAPGAANPPLASTTNTQAQPPPSLEMKPVAPVATASQNLFATPATSQPSGPTPTFTFTKPESTPSVPTPGSAALPSAAPPSSFLTQGATTSSAATAPSPPKPSFSFTPAPVPSSTSPSDANKGVAKPSLSFGPPTATAKPAFSFGTPTQAPPAAAPAVQAPKTEPAKAPAFSFATPPTNTGVFAQPTKAPGFSFATPPANTGVSAQPTKTPAFSFATPPTNTPTSAESGKNEPPKAPAFSFATPPASLTTPAEPGKNPSPVFNPFAKPPGAAPTTNALPFTFNPSPQQQQPSQDTAAQNPPTLQFTPRAVAQPGSQASSSSGSGSLLNRLAPDTAPVTQTAQTQATWTPSATTVFGDGRSTRPFGTPSNTPRNTTTLPTATGIFGQSSQPQQPQPASQNIFSSTEGAAGKSLGAFTVAPSEPPKNIFGQPPPGFSFKPSPAGTFADPTKGAGQDAVGSMGASQTKTPFSFGFANAGGATAAASPFQQPVGGGAQTSPTRNTFTFGQPSFPSPSTAAFGFASKAAADGEKK